MTGTDPGRKGHCLWLVTGRVDASDVLLLVLFKYFVSLLAPGLGSIMWPI